MRPFFKKKAKNFCLTTIFVRKAENFPSFCCKVKLCWSGKIKRTKKADWELSFYFIFSKKVGWQISNPINKKSLTLFTSY